MPDHVHLLVSIPLKLSVSQFMGYLKGKSALMMFDRHANLKYKYGNRHFGLSKAKATSGDAGFSNRLIADVQTTCLIYMKHY